MVFVGEDAEMAWFDAETYACGDVFFGGLEPCVALGLFEDVVEDGVVGVVVHCWR